MRSYLKNARSPIAKPTKSQSPIQKKKYMKFVSQVARTTDKSMHELPILKLDSRGTSSPVPEFKRQIEEKFEKSEMSATYVFPRKVFANYSISSEGSDDSLNGVIEYDLHIQNFKHQIPHLRMHSQPDSKPAASDHNTIMQQSSSRVATQSSETTNQSRMNWRHGVKIRPQTPVEESSLLYKKAVGMLRQNSQKTLTHRTNKSPQKPCSMDVLKNKIKHKIQNSKDFSVGKENQTVRSQSSSKSASRGKFKTINAVLSSQRNCGVGKAADSNNIMKISELIEDDNSFVSKTMKKSQTTKSCQDLKVNSAKTLGQSTEAESSINTTYLRSERAQTKLFAKVGYGNPTNFTPFGNIYESITQKKMKRPTRIINGPKDKENLSARCLNQSNSNQRLRSRMEIKTTSFYDKKLRNTPSRDRSVESYRSPLHASKKPLNTEPLTARNFNHSRHDSQTPTKKSKRGGYENVICITSPGKQDVPIKLTMMSTNQPLQTKYVREYENSLSRLAKAANTQASRPKVPSIALRNYGQDQSQGGLHYVNTTTRVKKENNPIAKAKLESQMLLKRSGPPSARYDLDKSELRAKLNYYK